MSKSVTIGARISADLDDDLRKLAEATGRSKSRLVADAVQSYVTAEKELAAALDEGLETSIEVSEALKIRADD
ncbi:MAG: ribbon-helix-helix domain-containing protein [Alphaproteobacteria bacterium]